MRLNCETSGEKRQKHGPGQRFRGRRPPPGGGVQPARRRARPGTASPHPRWASANPGAELGRRRGPRSGPASSPAPLPPAVPAAPEPREPAAAAQVPEAALTPQVGAARRRRGRAQLQRGRVPAALAFRPPPDGPRQPAVPRPTGTQPWQRRRRRAPAPCGLAGPASLAAFGGLQCMHAFGPDSCRVDAVNFGAHFCRGRWLRTAEPRWRQAEVGDVFCSCIHLARRWAPSSSVPGDPRSYRAPGVRVCCGMTETAVAVGPVSQTNQEDCVPRLSAQHARCTVLGVWPHSCPRWRPRSDDAGAGRG